MTNKEKKQFILDAHKLYLKYRPHDKNITLEERLIRENYYWEEFSNLYYRLLPKTFFKFRPPTDENIENLKSECAWFSHPIKFDDTLDSTIDNDLDYEIKIIEEQYERATKELALAFGHIFSKTLGVAFDESLVDEIFPLFNKDGSYNKKETKSYLKNKAPEIDTDKGMGVFNNVISTLEKDNRIWDRLQFLLDYYANLNSKVKKTVLTLSLTEKVNPAMWTYFADESRGFCVEYNISDDTVIGRRMLANLLPVYYGKRPKVRFLDIFKESLLSEDPNNCDTFNEYKKWFLSTYTKDNSYAFQNEWRIVLPYEFKENLQLFPFVKSITLGERMDEEYMRRIIDAIKDKGISVFKRQLNDEKSDIEIIKLL